MQQATMEQLADATGEMGRLIAGIRQEQWSGPTPCADWDVRALVSHVVQGSARFAVALGGEPQATTADPTAAGFERNAAVLLAAAGRPDAASRIVEVPFGRVPGAVALHLQLTELLVHGWDLAVATGGRAGFSDQLAAQELEFTLGALASVPPDRQPFAPPQPVRDDAPTLDRLAATLGRRIDAPPS
ncbi:TIGR03086 family metal-binding protein [Actinoplanes sp. NPDC049681]|uniref:TIGR03086 family metal-binding protein n=1 Tax=Actinoplanes sp. NPDC049681 TaxID=3363905 RepID=UPI00378B27AF